MSEEAGMSYLNAMQERLRNNPALQKFLTSEQATRILRELETYYRKVYGDNYFKEAPTYHLKVRFPTNYGYVSEFQNDTTAKSSARFSLTIGDLYESRHIHLIGFEVTMYPYCCGMRQLNGFSYRLSEKTFSSGLGKELVGLFTDASLDSYHSVMGISTRRVMINFVETGRGRGFTDSSDIPTTENPDIQYDLFYEWAKKQKKYCASLMYNSNSGNILHHAEVVF